MRGARRVQQVTRGVAKRDHTFPQNVTQTVYMMSNPLATPSAEQIANGVAVVTAEDNRWRRCDLKTISLIGNVLMRQLAADADAVETVMFRDGFLTEASASKARLIATAPQPVPNSTTVGSTARLRQRRTAAMPRSTRSSVSGRGISARPSTAKIRP